MLATIFFTIAPVNAVEVQPQPYSAYANLLFVDGTYLTEVPLTVQSYDVEQQYCIYRTPSPLEYQTADIKTINIYWYIPKDAYYNISMDVELNAMGGQGNSQYNVFVWDDNTQKRPAIYSSAENLRNPQHIECTFDKPLRFNRIQFSATASQTGWYIANGSFGFTLKNVIVNDQNIITQQIMKQVIHEQTQSINSHIDSQTQVIQGIADATPRVPMEDIPIPTFNAPDVPTISTQQKQEISGNPAVLFMNELFQSVLSFQWVALYISLSIVAILLPCIFKWIKRS